jgi:hypothetical protein
MLSFANETTDWDTAKVNTPPYSALPTSVKEALHESRRVKDYQLAPDNEARLNILSDVQENAPYRKAMASLMGGMYLAVMASDLEDGEDKFKPENLLQEGRKDATGNTGQISQVTPTGGAGQPPLTPQQAQIERTNQQRQEIYTNASLTESSETKKNVPGFFNQAVKYGIGFGVGASVAGSAALGGLAFWAATNTTTESTTQTSLVFLKAVGVIFSTLFS